jgi:deoxyribonuclease-1
MNKLFFIPLLSFTLLSSCTSRKVIDYESGKGFSHVDITGEYFISDPKFLGNKKIKNFSQAKKIIKQHDYFGITQEIYCGCEFNKGHISQNAICGLKPRKNEERAYRIEFEHIVPFENQVGHTDAWLNGTKECGDKHGRKCASIVFAHMEADLWNLWPSAGELNADRSNYSFTELTGPRDQYGKCDFKVEDRKVAPRDSVKALIAFTYMYFQKTYAPFLKTNYISGKNEKLFEAWSKLPLSSEQCRWAHEVSMIQENQNEDLLKACHLK